MVFLPAAAAALLSAATIIAPARAPMAHDGHGSSAAGIAAIVARTAQFVPSFSRQTKLSCAMCHNGFPQLTAFGRMFKLNGYTMTGLPTITDQKDSAHKTLELSPIAPLSVMAIISNTSTATAVEGSQRSTTQFPQQVSLFAASAISPKAGIFAQFTYEDQSGTFGIDNVDIRYANHTSLSDRDILYGVTLHNNPTVQDVWNTTPAWGYPFTSSAVAPSPASATLIEGALSQNVLGLGAYALYDGLVYAEVTGYTSAPQGAKLPADSTATQTTHGMAPYWRVALQHTIGETYLMVGTFGMAAKLFPTGITGLTNRYRDIGIDAQLERKVGKGTLIGRASLINESQTNMASFSASPATAENPTSTLHSMKVNATYVASPFTSVSAGIFGVSGSHDGLLYAEGDVTGSAAGKPDSQGTMLEWTHSPWLNTRIGAQYVMYSKFNGRSTSYDVASGGRNARDNNTLYLYLWLAY
jgi:hypothetical protein